MNAEIKALYASNLTEHNRKERAIKEVATAEEEANAYLRALPKENRDKLDSIMGALTAAYELQGFALGYTVAKVGDSQC